MIVLRLVGAAALAGAGSVMALAQLNLPSKAFWDGQVALQWAGVLVVALFICLDSVRSISSVVQARRIREHDSNLRAVLCTAVSQVVLLTGVSWDEVAVCYYRRRRLPGRRRLVLMATVRAGADVPDAQRRVRSGVDVVGVAFAAEEPVTVLWRQFVETAIMLGREAWATRGERERYGLNWGQMQRPARPEGIVAQPTFASDGRADGCISLSGPFELPELKGYRMQGILNDVARALDQVGPPPVGWWDAHER